jgi:vacuolar-type H+-ATPase subunit D/Vma8
MDELKKLTNALEHIFLKQIIDGLRHETINVPDAKKSAQEFQRIEPFTTIDDAKEKMNRFVQQYIQFGKLKEYADAFHSEQKVDAKIEEMQKHIRDNNIDEALRIAKE